MSTKAIRNLIIIMVVIVVILIVALKISMQEHKKDSSEIPISDNSIRK